YKELLYTIAHKMGKPSSNELLYYLTLLSVQPPVYCLMATVKEAKGILGKDISGLSDPYCLLTIMEDEEESRTRQSRAKPLKSVVKDAVSHDKIYQTDIKKQTLNPIWNQTFILEFGHFAGASFHLEMWDKDEEVSLTQKLEEFTTNLNNLRRMIKEAKKEKGTDDFLGKVVIKLKELHCTEDNWYTLEPRTETYPDRGQCHLNLKFIHKGVKRCPLCSPCVVLQSSSAPWKGELCGEAQTLLELYATQNDLSPFLQDLAKWVAYSKLYQSLEVDSSVLLQQLTSIEYHWHQQELPYQQKQELGDSLHGFLQYGLCLVAKYRDIFPPTPSATPKLHRLLRYTILVQICKTQAFQKLNPAQFDLHDEVSDAIQKGTEDWFIIKKGLHQPMTKVNAVQVDVFTVIYKRFDSMVSRDGTVPSSPVNLLFNEKVISHHIVLSFSPQIAKEVRETLSLMEDQMEQQLANSLFPVYLKAQELVCLFRGVLELTNFHEGFREALPYWLNQAFSTTQDRVERAVQVDQLQPLQTGVVPIKHSSSAVDLVACIQPICQVWDQLSWPDPEEAFMLMVKITEDVCKIVVNYCKILKERVRVLSENSDHGSAINMLCVVVNDLEHLRTVLTRLPTQLNWAGLRDRTHDVIGESQFKNTLPSQLQQAQSILGREIRSALDTLGKKVSKVKMENWTAAAPLMRYLEQELQYMNENLTVTVSADLQKAYSGEKYGAVTLLASYRKSDQKLRIEVLNAVNLLPMDSNGLSDPFVHLCLEPYHIFPEVEPRCTQIKNCDLNPLFDEAFEFLVSLEQCQAHSACLVITVLDHDTLRSDDFEGEAFLSLRSIPGVVKESKGDGLSLQPNDVPAQIRLPLMHPKPNDNNILRLLESRKGDREAQAFVKKRRQREKQSQEAIQS
uniref:Unc-13 homolog D (C. elegans) n=1 Tax=Oreochromis niloticus TaxID=8128 RepID=A0A669CGR9_ORENI